MANTDFGAFDAFCLSLGLTPLQEEPMSRHTTFRVGGPAARFLKVGNEAALSRVLSFLSKEGMRYFLLGNGSNLLVADAGFRGVVLSLEGEFTQITREGDTVLCGGGAPLSSLCAFAREQSLTGLEFAWGIPGTAGGAAYMNAGAYGGEMKDVLLSCRHLEPDGTPGSLSGQELGLGYRKSAYTDSGRIITSLRLRLQEGDRQEIVRRMEELMARRKEKQPLEYPSAGSTFQRPAGYYAAALIEECGLKGVSVGGAQVSRKHSGFLINTGGATCADILALMELVRSTVWQQKGVRLENEVKYLS